MPDTSNYIALVIIIKKELRTYHCIAHFVQVARASPSVTSHLTNGAYLPTYLQQLLELKLIHWIKSLFSSPRHATKRRNAKKIQSMHESQPKTWLTQIIEKYSSMNIDIQTSNPVAFALSPAKIARVCASVWLRKACNPNAAREQDGTR